ncbi:MAG: SDR family oxidoreductase [Phycisphaerae bacterium]|nr:SDR family oxidoreductase [Phycisphaerae bacterium]
MNTSLHGRRALVCGSTAGIGRACAMELAAAGASVTLIARDAAKLEATLSGLPRSVGQEHAALAADFTDPAGLRRTVQESLTEARPYHILINNTGGPPGGTAIDAPAEQYIAAFNAHIIAGQHLVQLLVPQFKKAGYGRIINIISTSVKQPIPNLGVSNTIRAAVASWAKTLSVELGPFAITVNNVLPGYTRTERLASLIAARAKSRGVEPSVIEKEFLATIPAGRFCEPEETAAAVAFLASPAAGYINGINLPVDGGRLGCL